jgi:biopolymer transport protein ExbB/TolQ
MESNPTSDTWTEKFFMRARNTLGDRIRRGEIRSAWDDYDNEADAFAGRKSEEKMANAREIQEQFEQLRRDREEARKAQEERMRRAAEEERLRKERENQEQLEALDGFGSF